MMEMEYEQVYTVNDYYDGPRHGVADFCRSPHVYLSQFDDFDDQPVSTFFLQPVSHESMKLIMEDWAVWERWRTAFDKGLTKIDTHPALPEDKQRSEELRSFVEAAITINDAQAIKATGEFKVTEGRWWVRWTIQSDN